jgi:hypothetical protein
MIIKTLSIQPFHIHLPRLGRMINSAQTRKLPREPSTVELAKGEALDNHDYVIKLAFLCWSSGFEEIRKLLFAFILASNKLKAEKRLKKFHN